MSQNTYALTRNCSPRLEIRTSLEKASAMRVPYAQDTVNPVRW